MSFSGTQTNSIATQARTAGASQEPSAERPAPLKVVQPVKQDSAKAEQGAAAAAKPQLPAPSLSLGSTLAAVKDIVLPAASALVGPVAQAVTPSAEKPTSTGPQADPQKAPEKKSVLSRLGDFASSLIPQGVKDFCSKAVEYTSSLIPQGVKDFCSNAWGAVKTALSPLVDSCKSFFSSLFDKAKVDPYAQSTSTYLKGDLSSVITNVLTANVLANEARQYAENRNAFFKREERGLYGIKDELHVREEVEKKAEIALHNIVPNLPPGARAFIERQVIVGAYGQSLTGAAIDLRNGQVPEELLRMLRAAKKTDGSELA